MKENKLHSIFEQTDCLSRQNMLAYLNGEYSVNEQFQFEKHLNSCALCRDEFEGLSAMQDHKKLPLIVNELNKKVDDYLHYSLKKPFLKRYKLLRIAAVALILISSGFFINYYLQYSSKEYYDSEMVSQSMEEPASDVDGMLEKDSFVLPPVSEERASSVEKKNELAKDNSKNISIKSNKQANEKKLDNVHIISELLDDEDSDDGLDEALVIASTDEKTKTEEEPTIVAESSGEGVSDEKVTVSKELIEEEFSHESEEDMVFVENTAVNKRSLDNKMNRAKLSGNKRSKSKGFVSSYQQSGIDAYNSGNYSDANIALNNSVKYEGKEDKTLFYLGQTYSAQGDSKKALLNYNKLLKNKDSEYQNEAMWEKAKLLIKMQKRKSAINVLNDLVKVNSPYKVEAQQKLDSLMTNQ